MELRENQFLVRSWTYLQGCFHVFRLPRAWTPLFILNRGLLVKGIGLTGAISGYLLCVGSGSRMATWAVPISALMAWVVMRLKGRRKKFWTLAISLIALLVIALILWWYLGPNVRDNVYSDSHRLEAAVCWLSAMLSGNIGFIYGVGWSNEKLN